MVTSMSWRFNYTYLTYWRVGFSDSEFIACFNIMDMSNEAGVSLKIVSLVLILIKFFVNFRKDKTQLSVKIDYAWCTSKMIVYCVTYNNMLVLNHE